jgi:PIN domain nuclease of toxin-antitoxin system
MTPYLLDTCALLWWMSDPSKLGSRARRLIGDRRQRIFVSAASVWEIAIKRRKGRLTGVDEYLTRHTELHQEWGFIALVIETTDAAAAGGMAISHDDPFDRVLMAQAHRMDARILTCDESIRSHFDRCLW